jgi:hypothetical protein
MQPLRALFEWVDSFPSSIALRESIYVSPWLLVIHVLGMCLVAGLVMMMDLRLLGVGNTRTAITQIQRRLFPWQMAGMAVSAITGLALVYAQPMRFYGNIFFWEKMVMMALAGANAMAFHYGTYRSVDEWDTSRNVPFGARLSGAVSLVLWSSVILSGRLIAYNWFS